MLSIGMKVQLISLPVSNHSGHEVGEFYRVTRSPFQDGSLRFVVVTRNKTGTTHVIQAQRFVPANSNQGED